MAQIKTVMRKVSKFCIKFCTFYPFWFTQQWLVYLHEYKCISRKGVWARKINYIILNKCIT